MAYLDAYTTEDVKTMITAWYPGNAQGMEVNDDLLMVVTKILTESEGCSASMKWVPLGGNPFAGGVSVALTAARNYGINIVKNAARMQTYSIPCVKTVALKYKEEALRAGQGW